MKITLINNNLDIYLKANSRNIENKFEYMNSYDINGNKHFFKKGNTVVFFKCNEIFSYIKLLFRLYIIKRLYFKEYVFIDDGIMSCIVGAYNNKAYKAYSELYLSGPLTLKQKIVKRLPNILRADVRYIVIVKKELDKNAADGTDYKNLSACDFMFFSNKDGKLLLLNTKTLINGHGELIKTTANQNYISVMEKEYSVLNKLNKYCSPSEMIPVVGRSIQIDGVQFFTEKFIHGENLRELIRKLGKKNKYDEVIAILGKLDRWWTDYENIFVKKLLPTSEMYKHVFQLFDECYGSGAYDLSQKGLELLDQFCRAYPNCTPIIAHNDIWPGNVILSTSGIIVVDWERAKEDRAPFFDYFWMIISTSIEYLACKSDKHDYSIGLRCLFDCNEEVSRDVFCKIKMYLKKKGVAEEYLLHLLFLFLVELSVQGFQILKKQTAMDKLVFIELKHYAENSISVISKQK